MITMYVVKVVENMSINRIVIFLLSIGDLSDFNQHLRIADINLEQEIDILLLRTSRTYT